MTKLTLTEKEFKYSSEKNVYLWKSLHKYLNITKKKKKKKRMTL